MTPNPDRIGFVVTLNGTPDNPYARMGLVRNPFPQHADQQLQAVDDTLADLAAGPIVDEADLRHRLAGWSPEFIELCVRLYVPGRIVRFRVSYPAQEMGETNE